MATQVISNELSEQAEVIQMRKTMRGWVISFLIIGGLSIFTSKTLDSVWGVILIFIAFLSWINKMPEMFVLYGVMMAWASVNNFFSSFLGGFAPQWLALAAVQVVWAISILKQYKKYRHLQSEKKSHVIGSFGLASTVISALILVLPPLAILGVVIYTAGQGEAALIDFSTRVDRLSEVSVGIVVNGLVDFAVLALGLGITAVVSIGKKGWGIAGTVMSSIILAGLLCMYFLAVIGELANQPGLLPAG